MPDSAARRRPLNKAPSRASEPAVAARPEENAAPSRFSPEVIARRAVALRPTTPSGHRVKVAVTLFLTREVAECLTARAIREGKNIAALVGELVSREAKQRAS
jgi:hypothetical protein